MGTNYYARPRKDPHQLAGEGLHIGKASGGWEFVWRAYPDRGLTTASRWREILNDPAVVIVTESGVTLSADEFWVMLATRGAVRRQDSPDSDVFPQWRDTEGHYFAAFEFS